MKQSAIPYNEAVPPMIIRANTSLMAVWTTGSHLPSASQKKQAPQTTDKRADRTTSWVVLRGKDCIESER